MKPQNHILVGDQRLSQSIIWQIQRRCFQVREIGRLLTTMDYKAEAQVLFGDIS